MISHPPSSRLEDAEPFPPRRRRLLFLGDFVAQRLGFDLGVALAVVALPEDDVDGVRRLDPVHLHVVATLGGVVLHLDVLLVDAQGLVPLVHGDDGDPRVYVLQGLAPEVGDGRDQVLEGGVLGVVEEEGRQGQAEERALVSRVRDLTTSCDGGNTSEWERGGLLV